ncbi:MAG TPA: ATP-binding protein [Candidatus Limnocylindrales bacterium]
MAAIGLTNLPLDLPTATEVFPAVRFESPSIESPTHRQFLEALGVAVYTTDSEGRITFYNEAAAAFWGRRPELGELWCGSWRLFWPDGTPLAHDECPMAIALREGRSVRGSEAVAERPDGTRVAFIPYPTVVEDADGRVIGAVNVLVDVSRQYRAEEAAHAARAAKDEFLAMVSHELRTPVTTIFGNARLLRERGSLPDGPAAMIADIETDAERLLGVVENLLTLTSGTAARQVDREPQILGRVLSRVVASFERRHPGRSVPLAIQDPHAIVEADEGYLELLIGNLLSNAHKYSPIAAPIDVGLRQVDGEVEVTFLDRGIGIGPEDVEVLFESFYRAEAARKISGGLGIGLSACKLIVQLLGGRIWARPRPDGGSEFGFALPLSPDPSD